MKKYAVLGLSFIALGAVAYTLNQKKYTNGDPKADVITKVSGGVSEDMLDAMQTLMNALADEKKDQAMFAFEGEQRYKWHFTPIPRTGLSWEKMDEEQQQKMLALLKTTLSEKGLNKAREIMNLESILKVIEGRAEDDRYRHPEKYYLSIFGTPSLEKPWGWRFEGHHLSLNFSSIGDSYSVTPSFMGSNPARVPSGPFEGKRVLKAEEDMARTLMDMFDRDQLEKAIISENAPDDIVTFVDKKVSLNTYEGLKVEAFTDAQRIAFLQLLRMYLGKMREPISAHYFARIEEDGIENMYFAWAGSLEVGDRHYYRIHAPSILIEYDNTQNNANHIHTVWRDPVNDFGENLLKQHYETADHHRK